MKLYYYQAEIRINTTALIELFKKEIQRMENEVIKAFEIYGTIYIALSKNDIMKEIESLYPNVFKKCEPPTFKGKVVFSNTSLDGET
ncbi:MAG TPA: hypothetical protein VKG26_00695 [Bacteroidia bacterium]|nr:hypothetical protein [Bacteroidia bacterium]